MQVLTAVEEFAVVRDKLQELGQRIDHDHSGLVYTPLTHVEVLLPFPQRHSVRQQIHPCCMHWESCMSTRETSSPTRIQIRYELVTKFSPHAMHRCCDALCEGVSRYMSAAGGLCFGVRPLQ